MRKNETNQTVTSATIGLTFLAAMFTASATARAAEPRTVVKPREVTNRADRLRHVPEFLEMVWMIVTKGADMGPTDGWFHGSKSRYGWDWLKACDKDGDGSISPDEVPGPAELFRRLDRDRDGAIKADDFDWTPRSDYLRRQSVARRQFATMDTNTNGKISRAEWDAYFVTVAKDKAALTVEDLGDILNPPPPLPQKEKDDKTKTNAKTNAKAGGGPSRWTLMTGLFRGELGSRFEGPNVGDVAPDFTLKTHDGKEEITLSKLRGETPVVLIFGSFT